MDAIYNQWASNVVLLCILSSISTFILCYGLQTKQRPKLGINIDLYRGMLQSLCLYAHRACPMCRRLHLSNLYNGSASL